jgi:hypothetical protein
LSGDEFFFPHDADPNPNQSAVSRCHFIAGEVAAGPGVLISADLGNGRGMQHVATVSTDAS